MRMKIVVQMQDFIKMNTKLKRVYITSRATIYSKNRVPFDFLSC